MPTRSLWNQNLGQVPLDIFQQTHLTELILAGNALTEIPPRIAHLQNLRTLDLGHNLLAALPTEFGDLTGLSDFLYLHDNRLTTLPDSLARLADLRHLDLRGNPLTHLPACLADLPRLAKLDLRWTPTLAPQPWFATLEARGCLVYR